uniref:Uncharacterized protein n=1 Tax=Anopheles culicifacies TaxID=139723 RepID=A0A182M9S5_9DIPT
MLCDGTKLAVPLPAPADACMVVTLTLNGGHRSPVRPVMVPLCVPYVICGLPPPPDDVPVPPVPPVLLVVLVVLSICALLSELKLPADPPLPPPPLALNSRWFGLTACDCSSPIVSVLLGGVSDELLLSKYSWWGDISPNITESRSEKVKSDSFSKFSLSSGCATSSISSSMNEASALHRLDTSCFTMSDGLATGSLSRRKICSSIIFASLSASSENWFCVWQ